MNVHANIVVVYVGLYVLANEGVGVWLKVSAYVLVNVGEGVTLRLKAPVGVCVYVRGKVHGG